MPALPLALAFLSGVLAGSRSMTAPAAIAWAAWLGRIDAGSGWALVFGHPWGRWIWSALALGELVADQHPAIPSRTTLGPFAGRVVSGAVCGAAIGASRGSAWLGGLAGVLGAVAGTLGGRVLRARMADAFGRDRPAALVEDALALALAVAVVALL